MVDRRPVEDGSFLADGLAGSTPPEVYEAGRICIEPECRVRLSRYNSTDWCALHESPASSTAALRHVDPAARPAAQPVVEAQGDGEVARRTAA